jgi:hypothetical protein
LSGFKKSPGTLVTPAKYELLGHGSFDENYHANCIVSLYDVRDYKLECMSQHFLLQRTRKKAYEKQNYSLTIYYNVDQSPHERFEKNKGFP